VPDRSRAVLDPQGDWQPDLQHADVLLFVRGQISSRRGSAIAGIACGLPVVGFAGPETGWPITEAGFVPVPMGDREGLSVALQRVLSDATLRASLRERSRRAQEQYFSWHAIAARYADTLGDAPGDRSGVWPSDVRRGRERDKRNA